VINQDSLIPIFDGHNDTIMKIRDGSTRFFDENNGGHLDLPRAQRGGLVGGMFAIWVPSSNEKLASGTPPIIETESAQHYALSSLGRLHTLERESNGSIVIVRTTGELQQAIDNGTFAVELHIEGAEPIDADLESLPAWYAAGVRSIGLVWSRPNLFGHGVPFAFGVSPDTGPGLTDAGRALVNACNELGILVDLSHLNEAGFWDVAKVSDAPLVATHSNVWSITPSTRNLTDRQLDAIKESQGIVGINFGVGFLNPEGNRDATATTVSNLADHALALVERLGIDGVAFGSDFDGTTIPAEVNDAAGLPLVIDELRRRGFDETALCKIGYENWLRVLGATWKA
jgi:membrane dipeptidase